MDFLGASSEESVGDGERQRAASARNRWNFLQVVEALKAEGAIPRRVALRQCKYLNNVIEQDHRAVKKRVWLAKGYGSFQSAWRTLQGIETVHMIRKGRVRWLAKGDVAGQALFVAGLFGLAA
jgi:transposase, IS6 family